MKKLEIWAKNVTLKFAVTNMAFNIHDDMINLKQSYDFALKKTD